MNADAIRHLYDYHFTANRKIWNECVLSLTDEQFTRQCAYSVGSVRNQVVHMMNIDDRWFSGLRGEKVPGFLNPVYYTKRDRIRQEWDGVETTMRDYLAALEDEKLSQQPFLAADGDPTPLWQILMHVVIHGADHRAQLLALLHQLGVKTFPQDYYFFVKGKL